MTTKTTRVPKAFIITGALLTLGWLATYIVPATREMLVSYAFSMLFNGLLVAWFWRNARQGARRFWGWLAAAWGIGLLGNIVWGILDMFALFTAEGLATLSLVDLFYLARYALVFLALAECLPRPARRWEEWIALGAMATALVWLALYRPVLTGDSRPFSYFIGLAIYPVLDLPLIYLALLAWAYQQEGPTKRTLGMIVLSMFAYGIANWLNFSKRAVTLEAYTHIADLFWFLSDLLAGGAALYASARAASRRQHPQPRGLVYLPIGASILTLAAIGGDWILHSGRPDGLLITSGLIALATLGLSIHRGRLAIRGNGGK